MPNLLESASNLHAARLRREFSARDLLGATLAAIERLVPAANAIVKTIPHRPGVARATRIRASRAARPAPPIGRPRTRFFDQRSLPSRSASARDAPEHAGFHRHSGAAATPSPGVGTVFRAHRRGALPARPHGTHPARSKARSACAIYRGQWQTKALFRPDAVGLSRYWRRFTGMLGVDGLPRGLQIIAASFEDRTAIACAAMLEALGASFKAPPMASP
jgi:hypothetical protein